MRNRLESTRWPRFLIQLGLAAALGSGVSTARGQQDPIVQKAAQYLSSSGGFNTPGEAALSALAMMKAELSASDPGLTRAMKTVRNQFDGTSYKGAFVQGSDIYTAAVIVMALSTADSVGYRAEIESVARHLISRQNPNGSWDYPHRTAGDTSISQYAVLGLWEAENSGVTIAPVVWDRAAAWYLSVQSAEGSWTYHRDEGSNETVSMTAAGVGSLLICSRQLVLTGRRFRSSTPC